MNKIEAPIPENIFKYKAKMFMGLDVRQFFSVIIAGIITIFMVQLIPRMENLLTWLIVCSIPGMIIIFFAFKQIYGQPAEKMIFEIIKYNYIYPAVRVKEEHHPEYEKFRKDITRTGMPDENPEEPENANAKEKGKNKPVSIKIKKSKEFRTLK
jgi:hypothetical protein